MNIKIKATHAKNMQQKIVIYITIFLVSLGIFAGLFPYPIFSDYTNVTSKNMFEINNFSETELAVQKNTAVKVESLEWEVVDLLMEYDKPYKLIDLESGVEIYIQRTGGTNHAEIETINEENTIILKEALGGYSYNRRPCYLQLNDNLYVSASLSSYPHGYNEIDNNLGGHLCLHFKNSKTHSTNISDKSHQKAIKKAQNERYNFFNN